MATEVTRGILDVFPDDFIIVTFSSGIIVFLLSPLRFLVPNWIPNPFQYDSATETLGRFGIIVACSFVVGLPFFLWQNIILGSNGVNHGLRAGKFGEALKKLFCQKMAGVSTTPPSPEFYKWIKEESYNQTFHWLVVKNALVNGLILGFEFSLFANAILLIAKVFLFFSNIDLITQISNLEITSIFLLSLIFFLLIWAYNGYWKIEAQTLTKPIVEKFQAAVSPHTHNTEVSLSREKTKEDD